MTKAQILDAIIEKKRDLLSEAKANYFKVKKSRDSKYFTIIQDYFGGDSISNEEVYIEKPKHGGTTYEVRRPHPEYSYDKELFTIRVNEDWREGGFSDITTSVYSTSDKSRYELERLVTVGEVALIILDHGDDMIAAFNTVTEKYKKRYNKALTEVNSIEKDINSLINEKNQTFLDIASAKLNGEGLKFDGKKKGTIDLRWDWTLRGITSARIIRTTASGKSADIEISCYGETPRIYEKVRTSNIEALEWQYRDYVINAETE